MEDIKLFPLKEKIKEIDYLLAHTKENKISETLEEHLVKTLAYFKKVYKERQMASIKKTLYTCLNLISAQEQALFDEMMVNTFYMHDVGKLNLNFQLKRMHNPYFKEKADGNHGHSLLSAAIYIEYFLERIREMKLPKVERERSLTLMVLNAYVISKHHAALEDFASFEKQLKDLYVSYEEKDKLFRLYKGNFKQGEKLLEKLFINVSAILKGQQASWENTYVYIYIKLMYSLLVASDFYATSDYMASEAVEEMGILKDPMQWQALYQEGNTPKQITAYKAKRESQAIDLNLVKDINVLRSEMFLEARANLKHYKNENIFYLEAPTGSGKTNTSIQLALDLLEGEEKQKIFYVFPFNTLVEQTKKTLDDVFKEKPDLEDEIVVVNSLTPLVAKDIEDDGEEELNYNRMLLDRQFFHYPFIITSHVQLFNLLFGVGREDGVAQYQLMNSIVILDEVQSYKNTLWTEMIAFLKAYSKLLHMKVIIMSATLPRLGQLLEEQGTVTTLITHREKYFSHPVFKNRVQLDYSLLKEENAYDALLSKVLEILKAPAEKVLIEFIKKKTANTFYNDLVERAKEEDVRHEILLLTGDDSKWERERCIERVKAKGAVVLVATQIIEAGVDIDMDIGFKDISLLDAEEQFLGRINRSCKKENCRAYFFNLDEARVLYKKDYRKQEIFTLLNPEVQTILSNKDFVGYYEKILACITEGNKANNDLGLAKFKEEELSKLRFQHIKKHMQLIDEDLYPMTVFLGLEITTYQEGTEIIIDGKDIWRQYSELIRDSKMDYAEKKVKLSLLREPMSAFMWKVKSCQVAYNERLGDIYYIEDGENYLENGKFSREKISQTSYEIL